MMLIMCEVASPLSCALQSVGVVAKTVTMIAYIGINTFSQSPAPLTGTRADWRALFKFSTQIYLGDFPVPASQLPSRTRQTTHEALLSQTASQLRSRTRQTTPPLRQPALTGPVHAFSVHFSAPPNTFNIFILRQKCSRIALVRFRLERLQKLTFYNQTNEEN